MAQTHFRQTLSIELNGSSAWSPVANRTVANTFLVGGLLVGVLALYWATLLQLPSVWNRDPNYSHGYFIPVLALWFAWRAWREGGAVVLRADRSDVAAGVTRIMFGLTMHGACTILRHQPLFDVLSLVLVISGTLRILAGAAGWRRFTFPVVFLLFMAPLPWVWNQWLALQLQSIASVVSEFVLSVSGVPVFREGCYISLPGYQMEVGEACSGLRGLTAIFVLALAIGHLSRRGRGYMLILALLAAPIAVVANCLRVTSTGFILMWFGREWADGIYHALEGLAVILIAAGLLFLAAGLIARRFPCRL